jgi:hypothetical protein
LVQNTLRAVVVEAMIDLALRPDWRWCSADWAGWDFEHSDGTRLESAARQTWTAPRKPGQRRFDVAHRQGRWEGSVWIAEPGRRAHLYVFADHPIIDDTADHRDPMQWRFYAVAASELPSGRTISLSRVGQLTEPCGYAELAATVERFRVACTPGSAKTAKTSELLVAALQASPVRDIEIEPTRHPMPVRPWTRRERADDWRSCPRKSTTPGWAAGRGWRELTEKLAMRANSQQFYRRARLTIDQHKVRL